MSQRAWVAGVRSGKKPFELRTALAKVVDHEPRNESVTTNFY